MIRVYIIPGYGTPENIMTDATYNKYMGTVAEEVLNYLQSRKYPKCMLIFSGGKTALDKPFNRSESGEMIRLFKKIFADKRVYHGDRRILIKKDDRAISTVEVLVNSYEKVRNVKHIQKTISIFSERTRVYRQRQLAKRIFNKFKIKMIPVNLYNEGQLKHLGLMRKKEKVALELSMWALRSKENYIKQHRIYAKKFRILRNTPLNERESVNRQLWREALNYVRSGQDLSKAKL